MGRHAGTIRKLPKGTAMGEIESMTIPGLTAFFDNAALKRATGPGGMIKDARVSFEMGGNGRAIGIIRSHSNNAAGSRTHKRYQSVLYKNR